MLGIIDARLHLFFHHIQNVFPCFLRSPFASRGLRWKGSSIMNFVNNTEFREGVKCWMYQMFESPLLARCYPIFCIMSLIVWAEVFSPKRLPVRLEALPVP